MASVQRERDPAEIQAAVYHEAGHAVAAMECRVKLTQVSIIADSDRSKPVRVLRESKRYQGKGWEDLVMMYRIIPRAVSVPTRLMTPLPEAACA